MKSRFIKSEYVYLLLFAVVIAFLLTLVFGIDFFSATAPMNTVPPVSLSDHIRGANNASLTIIEYSDFECPDCQYIQPVIKQILYTYGKHIRWIQRSFPLPQHINAQKEAEAAECVGELGGENAFWKFSDSIFAQENITENGTGFPLDNLAAVGKTSGVNPDALQNCVISGKYYKKIQDIIVSAETAGIRKLPSIIVIDKKGNEKLITGNQPFLVFKTIFDQALGSQ